MKKCPFCAEGIQDEAIKCRFCGEMLQPMPPKEKWYFKTSALILAFLCVGPLALPLVWLNPHLKRNTKIVITVIILILTYYFGVLFVRSVNYMKEYYGQMNQLLN